MKTENPITPVFGTDEEARVAPKYEMPAGMMPGDVAYQIVHDEAMVDGNSRLNLATFVTTWMDDYARKVMTENMDKNMIDKTEYPQTAEIERRCVNILAKLWNSPEKPYCTGTSTVGSSEACMLGGIAALKRWQKRRKAKGLPIDKPNFIISTCMQVVWEKFAIYWDVEMRMIPVTAEKITLDPQDVVKACDENTICVVPIQGVTITGLNDNVKEINDALDKLNAEKGWEICIHVEAATGGFIHPFIDPETVWDFRLKWVLSISTSGHKYGLVYPGLGWVVWRETADLPESLIFKVSYLGGEMPTFALNFSRPGAQVLLQYYMFLRLGFDGYRRVQQTSHDVAKYLSGEIEQMDDFTLWNDGSDIPVFAWMLNDKPDRKWNLYDLQDRLRMKGWLVPAYPMPVDLTQVTVQRIVVRNGFSHDMAEAFIKDLKSCVKYLDGLRSPMPSEARASGFHH